MAIRDLPVIERPREKLSRYGPDKLSETELVAIILRTGRRGENALELAGKVVKNIDLRNIPFPAVEILRQIPGIGRVKACEIAACIELGKRLFCGKKLGISQLLSPGDVFDCMKDIRESRKEHFVVFFLDTRNQQIKREIVSVGTINASLVHPREVFEPAVKNLAVQVILAHNHPSGDLEPSEEDIEVNKRLSAAGNILGITVLDHVIVTKTGFMSFKEKGL